MYLIVKRLPNEETFVYHNHGYMTNIANLIMGIKANNFETKTDALLALKENIRKYPDWYTRESVFKLADTYETNR